MQRVFMLIQRGITDRTPVCVWPWERPILEEIHGGNAQPVTIDQLCDLQGASKIEKIKPRVREANGKQVIADPAPSMRTQYESMLAMDADENPLEDPEREFYRLAEKYGMHTQVNLPNVEKVYGSSGNFRMAMRDYARGKSPELFGETGPIEEEEDKPLSEMDDEELKASLRRKGIQFHHRAGRVMLEELYTDKVAA